METRRRIAITTTSGFLSPPRCLTFQQIMMVEFCLTLLFSTGMLAAALSDLEHRRVANGLIIGLAITAAAWIVVTGQWWNAAGILPAALLYLLCYKGGRGIGGADIKLAAATGLFHGLFDVLPVLLCACVVALAVELAMRLFKTRHKGGIPLCFYLGLSSITFCAMQLAQIRA